jgi:uncharacterized membrane protein
LWAYLVVALAALLGACGQVFFKIASQRVSAELSSWIFNIHFITGVCLYAVALIIFVWALKSGQLSVLYPIIATSYIWVLVFSYLVFGEPLTAFKAIGVGFIFLGIVLVMSK